MGRRMMTHLYQVVHESFMKKTSRTGFKHTPTQAEMQCRVVSEVLEDAAAELRATLLDSYPIKQPGSLEPKYFCRSAPGRCGLFAFGND